MVGMVRKSILTVLEKENRWLTFDALYDKAQVDCDWITFASHLERLVKRGRVRQMLPYGSDTSCYKLSRFRRKQDQIQEL